MLSRPCAEPTKSSLRSPIHHGAAEAARRPQHQHPLRIEHVLHPEAAADVGNADAKIFPGDTEHGIGERVANAVRAGRRGGQVHAAAGGVELPERATGFQRRGHDAVIHQLAFNHMGGVADRCFYRPDLAAVELERDIVAGLRPDRGGARQNRIRDRDHRLQRLVIDDDGFGSVAGAFGAFRDHECDGLADIANDVARQRMTGRDHERRGHRDTGHRAGQGTDIVGSQLKPGEHGRNAGHLTRRIDVDRDKARVRMRRAHHHAMQRVGCREIGDVAPAPPQEFSSSRRLMLRPNNGSVMSGFMEPEDDEGNSSVASLHHRAIDDILDLFPIVFPEFAGRRGPYNYDKTSNT